MPHRITEWRFRVEIIAIGMAVGVVGIAYGAASVRAGLPVWFAPVTGLMILAASSEMLFVGLLASGSSLLISATAALAVNTRHLPYGVTVADILGNGWARILRIHLINDETVAFATIQENFEQRRRALTWLGTSILLGWPLGSLVGSLAGQVFDVSRIGLDAMFPAVIAALVIPYIRNPHTRYYCVTAATLATLSNLIAPEGVAPLFALIALPLMQTRRPQQKGKKRRAVEHDS